MLGNNMQRKISRRAVALGTGATLASTAVVGKLAAQDSTPQATGESLEAEVLLTGLADPRFLVIDGTDIYFTESGTGGDEEIFTNPGEGTPEPEAPISQAGRTGKVSRLAADGTVTAIAADLMSYTFGAAGEIVGPAGLALDGNGSVFVSVGAPGPYVAEMPRTGEEGVLLKIDIETGEQTVVSDLIAWEIEQNPDPVHIDSNPYGISYVDGNVFVADAGGNSIIKVDAETGETSTFAVTGGLPADFFAESGNPGRDGAPELDSVPAIAKPGPDGRLYVSYITGGPFPAGYAPIDAFSLDGEKERVVEGLTMTADIAWDSSGRMYAAIVSTDLINGGAGQVVRIGDDGGITVVVDNLMMTAGIGFDADDNLYILNKSSMAPGGGELVKYAGVADVADSAGTPVPAADSTPDSTDTTGADSYKINMIDTAFEPNELTIPADVDVTLTFENTGYLAHDFVLADPKMVSDVLGNGQTTEMVVNLPAGSYVFYCSQIGHRALGMEGKLIVK